ncbi:MAG: hypothetical protein IPN49_05980 [Saprospiraceae bacterium]|nr:hypothetical protein [Saprospiraceae bacterium]
MYNKLLKNGTAIAMIVGTIMIALFGIGIMTGETTVNDAGVEVVEVGLGLRITIILIVLAFIAMLLSIVKDISISGKKGIRSLIGFVVLIVLFFILKSVVTVEKGGKWDVLYKEYGVSESASGLVSAGLYTCGALLLVTIVVFIYSEVRSFFN